MLIAEFQYFITGEEYQLFFSQMSKDKFSNLLPIYLLLNIEITIDIVNNKAMVSNINRSSITITLYCNAESRRWSTPLTSTDTGGYGTIRR